MPAAERCLVFDPFAGVAGDMLLGALLDLDLPKTWLQGLVNELPVRVDVETTDVVRGGLRAVAVSVRSGEKEPTQRGLADILEIVDASGLPTRARERARATFQRLAEVEGQLHGRAPEDVHFHEVGAVDAIVDVVAVCAAVDELAVAECYTRPVSLGHGWVEAAHGRLPVPAPATLRLLEGIPVRDSGIEGEFATPTGAALLTTLTEGRGPPGDFVPLHSGFGAGSRDPEAYPNCLRAVLAELRPETRALCVIQADIDDMSPEYLPPLLAELDEAGAIDVWTQPVGMKKGRTGVRVEILAPEVTRAAVGRVLFDNSSTLGLRYWPVERELLPRATETIEWRGSTIRVKTSRTPAGHVRRKPEYDDIIRAAQASGLPPLQVRAEVERRLSREDARRDTDDTTGGESEATTP